MNLPDPLPPILSVELMAGMLECAESTVEELARRRDLPGLKYGQGWVFPRDATLQVLNAQAMARVKPPEPPPPPPKPSAVSLPVPAAGGRQRRPLPAIPNIGPLP
jgi:hypothetical protein